MNRRFNNKSIFNTERNNKDDLFNSNIEKNKARAGFEKSTNISDHDDIDNYYKSNQESNPFSTDDFIYEGEYLNGIRNGRGVIRKKANGDTIYEGFFKEDKFEGQGILYLNNGYIYDGFFKNGKKYGKGTLYSHDRKFFYEGDWIEDEKEGYGKEMFPDGSKFEGEFQKGKKNGKGKYIFTNGSKYEGNLKDDKLEGIGKFVWNDERFYEGEWQNNSINGFGIFIDSGKIYLGYFVDDKKNGLGIYISKNNSNKFIGYFRDNHIKGLTVILKDQDNFDNGNICITENGKTIPCNSDSERANLKLHQEYKDLKNFYQSNYQKVKQILECF